MDCVGVTNLAASGEFVLLGCVVDEGMARYLVSTVGVIVESTSQHEYCARKIAIKREMTHLCIKSPLEIYLKAA